MNKTKIFRYVGLGLFALWIFVILYILLRDIKSHEDGSTSDADTLTAYIDNLSQDQELQILKDSIQNLTHEKIILQEKLALAANDNYELRARVWAINEYIRTGRFPADSTVRRKFPRNHGFADKIRILKGPVSAVFEVEPGMSEQRQGAIKTNHASRAKLESLPGRWRSVTKESEVLGKSVCESIEGKVGLPSGACNRCFFRPSIGYASTLILVS